MKRLSLLVAVVVASLALLAVRSLLPAPSPNFVVIDPPRPLPDIAIADGEGKFGSPAGFRGKYVLLNIWATWCVPCRKEMPTLDRLEAKLGGPDFQVAALSIDHGGAEAIRKFYTDIGIRNLAVNVDARGKRRSSSAPSACRQRCSSTGKDERSGVWSAQPSGTRRTWWSS
jgi:thiol-disulfide isomerase/thioredoxin